VISILLLAAAAAASVTPVQAERDYARAAQTRGQWTAFRATAAEDALMFVPEPTRAVEWLAGRADPPVPVMWWPARSWVSCDGRLAVNFGPWLRKGGSVAGTFTTVWARAADGAWQWKLDRGNRVPKPIAAGDRPKPVKASCANLAAARGAPASAARDAGMLLLRGDQAPSPAGNEAPASSDGDIIQKGEAPDGTLRWEVRNVRGAAPGEHVVRVWRWDGSRQRLAVYETTEEERAAR
jgi:hypothetical protein